MVKTVTVYRTPLNFLKKLKRSLMWLFHAFILIETADGEFFSLEKGTKAITLQKSKSKEILLRKSGSIRRSIPVNLVKSVKSKSTMRQVFELIVERQLLSTPYNLMSENCKFFSRVLFNGLGAEEGVEVSVGPISCDLPHPTAERGESVSVDSSEESDDSSEDESQ
jgi:hypothetical protein